MSGSIATPCKCKLCGKLIGHYSLVWPPPKDNAAVEAANQQAFTRFTEALAHHLATMDRQGNNPRHARAMLKASQMGGSLDTVEMARNFDLPMAPVDSSRKPAKCYMEPRKPFG